MKDLQGTSSMRTLFITGASSAIGGDVLRGLLNKLRCIALVHQSPLAADLASVEQVHGGLEDLNEAAERVREANIVMHLAGLTHSADARRYFEVNYEGTRRLLGLTHPDAFFIYVSSRCLGEAGGSYAHSKSLAEEAVVSSGRRYAIVRPSEVYGSKAGEGVDRLVSIAWRFRCVLDFRWTPPVTYAPVARDEAAAFLVRLVLEPRRQKAVYTLCNSETCTARDIQIAVLRRLGRPVFRLPVPVRLLQGLQRAKAPLPFHPDQLLRLTVAKSDDNRQAREDYGFLPRSFLDYVASASAP